MELIASVSRPPTGGQSAQPLGTDFLFLSRDDGKEAGRKEGIEGPKMEHSLS